MGGATYPFCVGNKLVASFQVRSTVVKKKSKSRRNKRKIEQLVTIS